MRAPLECAPAESEITQIKLPQMLRVSGYLRQRAKVLGWRPNCFKLMKIQTGLPGCSYCQFVSVVTGSASLITVQ
jgi:hypothetical protein